MNDLLNDPEFQKLVPNLPLLIGVALLQIFLWLLLAFRIRSLLLLVKAENRMIPLGQVFLIAVPLVNIYWNFMVVKHLRDSLNNEFFDRKVAVDENPTQKEGNIFAWSFLVGNIPLPAFIGYMAMFINVVGYIMYWVKIGEYKKLLQRTADLSPMTDIHDTNYTQKNQEDI